jgi:predicted secreted protein
MANSAGRDFVVKKNSTAIASVRTKSFNWQGQTIDVTTDDEDGVTTFLDDKFASTTLEISVSGLTDADVLFDLAISTTDSDKFLSDITLERANGDEISGNWVLTGYSETGEYQGATTFEATLVRNGAHTFTAAV